MKQPHVIFIRGKQSQWAFNIDIDPRDLPELRDDGLEVYELGGSIPYWMAGTWLAPIWVRAQGLFRWRWLR